MCCTSILVFGARVIAPSHVAGLRVLEIGSFDVNGSLRPHVMTLRPASYLGTDMRPGPKVDRVIDASLPDFPAQVGAPYGLVVSTEMLEHARDWRAAVRNFKACVAPGGHLLVTTRSRGFQLHEYPSDYWRFELDDMRAIFADFEILTLVTDPEAPGLHFYARKTDAPEVDLFGIALYSMLTDKRETAIPEA